MAQPGSVRVPEGRKRAEERRRAQSVQGKTQAASKPASATAKARPTPSVSTTSVPSSSSVRTVKRSAIATGSGREAAFARRRALSEQGKSGAAASRSQERTRSEALRGSTKHASNGAQRIEGRDARSGESQKGCGCGGSKQAAESAVSTSPSYSSTRSPSTSRGKNTPARRYLGQPEGKQLALARRRLLSGRGKAGLEQSDQGRSPAQRARQLNPDLGGRELAREIRSGRSKSGGRGQKTSGPCGRQRPSSAKGAEDAPWKVGVSETARGQSVTGTQVGRSKRVSGDEASTCRAVTGTEYLAADIFREFCQTDAVPNPRKVALTKTSSGHSVTGTEVGRSKKVTGNEAGNCKRVTGNEYFPAGQLSDFCGTKPTPTPAKISLSKTAGGRPVSGSNVDRMSSVTGTEAGEARQLSGTPYVSRLESRSSEKPMFQKVGKTTTLRGGTVTGVVVGRSERVTGDEPGSCRTVTGDEYIGAEQYKSFCGSVVEPEAPKVQLSGTAKGQYVTGTQAGRSSRVTGDEPGTCKFVTGTPYVGMETFESYCAPDTARSASARTRVGRATPGMSMTGLQPGIGGKATGDQKGACEPLTGTPYIGQDQFNAACGDSAAVPGNPDFPQALDGSPWDATFSVSSPARDAQRAQRQSSVTGTRYEQGNITGPFVMGEGKITGTEQFRFGATDVVRGRQTDALRVSPAVVESDEPRSRVTGEGIDTGLKITGDDWGRNERVTGTEGRSAARRNPTRRGAVQAVTMPQMVRRPEPRDERTVEVMPSKVTGSSGNTDKGAFVTVSGGARG